MAAVGPAGGGGGGVGGGRGGGGAGAGGGRGGGHCEFSSSHTYHLLPLLYYSFMSTHFCISSYSCRVLI